MNDISEQFQSQNRIAILSLSKYLKTKANISSSPLPFHFIPRACKKCPGQIHFNFKPNSVFSNTLSSDLN